MITNNSYLDGLIHRDMRRKLAEDFEKLTVSNAVKVLLRAGSAWASYHGWKKAIGIANALIGQALVRPIRVFLGFSDKNAEDIANIWALWFEKIAEEDL